MLIDAALLHVHAEYFSDSLVYSISGRSSEPTTRRRVVHTKPNTLNIIVPTWHSRCKHAASPRFQPRTVNNCSPRGISHFLCRVQSAATHLHHTQHHAQHSTHKSGSQRFLPQFLLEGCPVCAMSPPNGTVDRLPYRYTPQTLRLSEAPLFP